MPQLRCSDHEFAQLSRNVSQAQRLAFDARKLHITLDIVFVQSEIKIEHEACKLTLTLLHVYDWTLISSLWNTALQLNLQRILSTLEPIIPVCAQQHMILGRAQVSVAMYLHALRAGRSQVAACLLSNMADRFLELDISILPTEVMHDIASSDDLVIAAETQLFDILRTYHCLSLTAKVRYLSMTSCEQLACPQVDFDTDSHVKDRTDKFYKFVISHDFYRQTTEHRIAVGGPFVLTIVPGQNSGDLTVSLTYNSRSYRCAMAIYAFNGQLPWQQLRSFAAGSASDVQLYLDADSLWHIRIRLF